MIGHDIRTESWRAYRWTDPATEREFEHVIEAPQRVYIGQTTHRVVDSEGVTHLVPSVGNLGCVVTYKSIPEISF